MELEQDYKTKGPSRSGSEVAYSIEARYNYANPIEIAGQLFDNRWRRVDFNESLHGVPRCAQYLKLTIENNLLGYSAAQALRWWLHAIADADFNGICLETRIMKHKIAYSLSITVESAHQHIHGDDRSNMIPDWN